MPGPDPRKVKLDEDKRDKKYSSKMNKKGKMPNIILDNMSEIDFGKGQIYLFDEGELKPYQNKAKGGRAGYKSGGRGCKLAMKGKGRAYGKNS